MTEADMGGYSDYRTNLEDGRSVAGACHAGGMNANFPARWLIYIVVQGLGKSLARCRVLGGRIVDGPGPWEGMAGSALYKTKWCCSRSMGARCNHDFLKSVT